MYFGHKHVETGPNYSYGHATFFKYHMPLTSFFQIYFTNYLQFDILFVQFFMKRIIIKN